jgi:PAS domain S-box-containing protein
MIHALDDSSAESESRIQFECFIADRAAGFTVILPPDRVESRIEHTLRDLLGVVRADRAALLGGAPGEELAWVTCAASTDGADRPFGELDFAASFPWHFRTLCAHGHAVVVGSLADLPVEAAEDRRSAEASGIRSMLAVPVAGHAGGPHCLIIQSREQRVWPAYYVARLRVLVEIFVNALNQKRAEETLQQLEISDGHFLESVGAILWRADARTFQTTFVSKEAEAILGYPLESWLRVPGFWRDHIHPDDRAWVEAFSGKATQEQRRHDFEYRMIVADGRTVWLRNIVNVVARDEQSVELVGVTVDITARKQAEIEAARLRHQLAHAGRVRSLGELAATLAHELNQPLGAIVSNAEAALVFLERRPPSLDSVQAVLGDIVRDGQRAGAVVHRVRILLQNQVLERQPLDLTRLVGEVVGLTRAFALSHQVDLVADLAPDVRPACGDTVQIQQVLLNLVLNAIEAVADRPAGERRVRICAVNTPGGVELSVVDTGTGIAAETLPHVFDPFFTTKVRGLGMGLSICRSIVRSHGGDIRVENNPEGGATVRFTVPGCGDPEDGS